MCFIGQIFKKSDRLWFEPSKWFSKTYSRRKNSHKNYHIPVYTTILGNPVILHYGTPKKSTSSQKSLRLRFKMVRQYRLKKSLTKNVKKIPRLSTQCNPCVLFVSPYGTLRDSPDSTVDGGTVEPPREQARSWYITDARGACTFWG